MSYDELLTEYERLKAHAAQLQAQAAQLEAENSQLREQLKEAQLLNEQLRRELFGPKADKLTPEQEEQQGQRHPEGHVADAGDDEGLAAGIDIGLFGVPEADEGVGTEPHSFPAQVDKDQVVGHRDHQHGKDKQVQIAEIPDVI